MSVTLRHNGLSWRDGPPSENTTEKPPTRFNLKDAVRRSFDDALVTHREREYLLFSIDRCTDDDFKKGAICAHWVSSKEIAKALGCTPRQINTIERSLEKKTLIVRTMGAKGRRYGCRPSNFISFAAGINLAPLIGRFKELVALSEALDRRDDAIQSARAEIQLRRREIRGFGDEAAIVERDAILPRGRTSEINDFDRLNAILSALDALLSSLKSICGRAQTSTWSDASSTWSEVSTQPNIQKPNSEIIRPKRKESEPTAITNEQVMLLATQEYRWLVECVGGPSPQNFTKASRAMASNLHFRPGTFDWMCHKMGSDNAALAVLIIDRNSQLPTEHPFHRHNPGGSAIGMGNRWSESSFNSRSLHALLGAMQGYQEAENANATTPPQSMNECLPEGVTRVGNSIAKLISGIQMSDAEGAQ